MDSFSNLFMSFFGLTPKRRKQIKYRKTHTYAAKRRRILRLATRSIIFVEPSIKGYMPSPYMMSETEYDRAIRHLYKGFVDANLFCNPVKDRMSQGEYLVSEYLDTHGYKYKYGYVTKHIKYKKNLHFDFWMPYIRTAIEYDGKQHFEPVSFWGGIKAFRAEKIRDRIKNKYCKSHGIHLIRIPYDKSISTVLNDKLA